MRHHQQRITVGLAAVLAAGLLGPPASAATRDLADEAGVVWSRS